MAIDDNLKYALETIERIASKNTESRIAKNLDFLFGENYSKYGAFRRAVDDLFTKIIPSSDGKETLKVPHRERMDIINEKLNAFDISNSKEAYEAYDNMMGYVKTGIYRTSPFSLRGNSIFDEVVNRAKEQGLLDKDIRALFETTIENAKHYGVYNSDWEISDDIYNSYFPDSASKEVKRTKRQKDRKYRINDDIVNGYREELAKIQAEQRSLNLKMEYEGETPESLARFEELQTRAHTLIETINHRTGNFTIEEFRAADGDINKLNQLQLNPPREGAPMFEGLAVPSELVDENGNAIATSNTIESRRSPESNPQPEVLNNTNDIDLDEFNKQWYENKQKEFAERELEIQKEFSDINNIKPEDVMGDTVEETIENTAKTVAKNAAGEVIEEAGEKIIKKATGINVELDGLNKKRTPKKLKKGTEKLKNKTDKYVSERRQKYEQAKKKYEKPINNTIHIDDEIDLDEINKQWYESKQKEFEQRQKEIDDYFENNADIDPEDVLKDDYEPDVNKFTDDIDTLGKNFEQGKDFDINKGIDETLDAVNKTVEETTREGGSISKYLKEFSNMGFFDKVQTLGAAAGAVSEYKNARRQGHGVVSSTIRAGVDFALGEAMGMYYPLFLLAKEAPGMIVKGSEMLYKENRKMNSAANQQIFGNAQFQDTQQLATMRQSGMEMAKMAQYNLQQTLMGNEATYFHR